MKFADSFRAARWVRLINLLLQAILFLTLFGGLNYVALNHAWRFDLTASRRHSLSAETKSYLERLEQPVRIIVTLTDEGDNSETALAFRDISGLLREYTYATRNNKNGGVRTDFLDVYQRRRDAEALGLEQPNVVVVISGDHRRTLTLGEFYRTKDRKRDAFQGEATLTAAILDVSSPEKKKIYFLAGHGEMSPDEVDGARGLSQLRDELRQRNFALAGLDLAITRKVPDDAALLLVVSPQGRYQPFEEELLRNFLTTRAGRVVLMLDPKHAHGLDNLLFDWGVMVFDDVIYDTSPDYLSDSGEIILRHFAPHPITQNLINNKLPVLVGPSRTIGDEAGRSVDDGLSVRKLIATGDSAWGERSYRLRIPPQYTPGQDLRGQLGVLVVSERVKPANLELSVRGGRLAVFGTADLVTNNRLINVGNLNLFLATVNWSVDRDTQSNIPARQIERFQLTLSREELIRLRLALLLGVPGAVGLLGLLVYWTRRN